MTKQELITAISYSAALAALVLQETEDKPLTDSPLDKQGLAAAIAITKEPLAQFTPEESAELEAMPKRTVHDLSHVVIRAAMIVRDRERTRVALEPKQAAVLLKMADDLERGYQLGGEHKSKFIMGLLNLGSAIIGEVEMDKMIESRAEQETTSDSIAKFIREFVAKAQGTVYLGKSVGGVA